MSIDFDEGRWQRVQAVHRQWWQGKLARPLIPIVLRDRDPGRPQPDTPLLTQSTCADLAISADRVIDRIDHDLSQCRYLGDAFPYFNMDCFGPGVLAAFLGARLDNSTGLVWFHPEGDPDIENLHFQFDPENPWFRRVYDLYAAGMKRWQGRVLMGMTDIGGNLDVLSAFRPGEKLLMDLYDHPEHVKRLTWEAHEAWHQCFKALNSVLQSANPGYSDWSSIYSESPSYILQCDFCYMIGTGMFDEFVKPELVESCEKLANPFYHLDGVGQLPHLKSVLEIRKLRGVQWIPGAGQPGCAHWPEVYQEIRGAGKLTQVYGTFETLDAVREQLGSAEGIHARLDVSGRDEKWIRAKLGEYGIVGKQMG